MIERIPKELGGLPAPVPGTDDGKVIVANGGEYDWGTGGLTASPYMESALTSITSQQQLLFESQGILGVVNVQSTNTVVYAAFTRGSGITINETGSELLAALPSPDNWALETVFKMDSNTNTTIYEVGTWTGRNAADDIYSLYIDGSMSIGISHSNGSLDGFGSLIAGDVYDGSTSWGINVTLRYEYGGTGVFTEFDFFIPSRYLRCTNTFSSSATKYVDIIIEKTRIPVFLKTVSPLNAPIEVYLGYRGLLTSGFTGTRRHFIANTNLVFSRC